MAPKSAIDERAARLLAVAEKRKALQGHVLNVLKTEEWIDDTRRVERVVDHIEVIRESAESVRGHFLEMGRALLALQEIVSEGGYKALHKAGIVPLTEHAASQLRVIARAVDAGHLPADRLPRGAQAAAMAARLEPLRLRQLVQQERIGPGTTVRQMREIIDPLRAAGPEMARPLTKTERKRLERKLERLRAEVRWLEARLERR